MVVASWGGGVGLFLPSDFKNSQIVSEKLNNHFFNLEETYYCVNTIDNYCQDQSSIFFQLTFHNFLSRGAMPVVYYLL